MDERQAFAAIRNAIHLEALGERIAAELRDELRAVFIWLADQLERLPTDDILRRGSYRQLLDRTTNLLMGSATVLEPKVRGELDAEVPKQLAFAERYVTGSATAVPTPTQLAVVGQTRC